MSKTSPPPRGRDLYVFQPVEEMLSILLNVEPAERIDTLATLCRAFLEFEDRRLREAAKVMRWTGRKWEQVKRP